MRKLLLFVLLLLPLSIQAQNIDIRLLRAFNDPKPLIYDGFFAHVSNSDMFVVVGTPVVMSFAAIIDNNDKLMKKAFVLAEATVINLSITTILKYSVQRERPFVTYRDIINKSGKVCRDPSFPSGHTSTAFATATMLSMEFPKWYVIVPSYGYACTVGYSRMRLGVHYPSDVLMGAIIGTGSAYLTHVINKKLHIKY